MSQPEQIPRTDSRLIAHFQSEGGFRSRSVSPHVLHGTLAIPQPPLRLTADWDKEIADLDLALGDVESLPLARTIVRWPEYRHCGEAVTAWMQTLGLHDLLDPSDLALMACVGARYHFDAQQYAGAAFCNLFLSEDKGLDLHFPALGKRIPLIRGTALIFDTAQPHAVIPRGHSGFNVTDFVPEQDYTQVFLTWELPIENAQLGQALKIDLDVDSCAGTQLLGQHVSLDGVALAVCPDSGQWLQVG